MTGGEPVEDQEKARLIWLEGRDAAVETAKKFVQMNVHKQFANRVLEPYTHVNVVVTATDFANFFALRYHEDAMPEIQTLASEMWRKYALSSPVSRQDGDWHIPFVDDESCVFERHRFKLIPISVARCARVSYKKHDGTDSSYEEDLALYERLLRNSPVHASPAEHQAMAVGDPNVRSGNFRGWIQYRHTLRGHTVEG